jgi:hypothetical protein
MRTVALLALLGLAACSRTPNSFEVRVDGGAAIGAEVRLCGEKIPLAKAENRFAGPDRGACEGSGDILVSFSDRRSASCRIGYVTPGLAQSFGFIVKDGDCRPV